MCGKYLHFVNFLEKNKISLANHELTKKILTSLYPIVPSLSSKIYMKLLMKN